MRALSVLGPLFFAAASLAQAVEEGIAPDAPPPEGCEITTDKNFTIAVVNGFSESSKRETALEASAGALTCTLDDGVLRDQYGRTGSIVANRQFQFDGPPQAGAIYTGGFSVCQNKSLAIGGSTRWWRCMSGEFGNLYDESIGGQCQEIRIVASYVDDSSPSSSSSSASAEASTLSEDISAPSTATPTASSNDSSSSTGQPSFTPPASTGTSVSSRPTGQGESPAPPAPTAGTAPHQILDRAMVAVLFGLAVFL